MPRRATGERTAPRVGRVLVGTSGYVYPSWRGRFYPPEIPVRKWLDYIGERFDSLELNGTFYSLKSPAVFAAWARAIPRRDFVFAVKGSRFITHNKKLAGAEGALANFYASGVLALGKKTGPFLWQLPATYAYSRARMEEFMALLPRDTAAAERLAEGHDERLKRGALTVAPERARYRHAFEVRHPSYFNEEFYELLRARGMAFVIADTAGKFPYAEAITADFVYVRLHGSQALYASSYTDAELDAWAERLAGFAGEGRDVYVYFDNDVEAYAPNDALRLIARLRALGVVPERVAAAATGTDGLRGA